MLLQRQLNLTNHVAPFEVDNIHYPPHLTSFEVDNSHYPLSTSSDVTLEVAYKSDLK